VVTLFAANLLGVFEVALPGWLADIAAGSRALSGNFATGALATLLATPCSAPFLGTAIGFALAAGPVEILAIFVVLGVGLALPYLVVATAPSLARLLPRPGHWMIWLRRLLGLLLGGTVAWLLAVLAVGSGTAAALGIALLMAGMVAALALIRASPARAGLAAAVVLLALAVPLLAPAPAATARIDDWRRFDREAIAGLVREGKIVFVDVTADWCLTCQVNKRLVLDRGVVHDALGRAEVVAMRADWTRPDAGIAAYLGRYGIPFNAIYGPSAPNGIALPELLTEGGVLGALKAAEGTKPAREKALAEQPAGQRGGGT
jgi:suppressor for copper-sensitivity B